jgi:hypothetical protein
MQKNDYGNIDIRNGVSDGYAHIRGKRLQPLCKKLNIEYAEAFVGFKRYGMSGYKPVIDGIVIKNEDLPHLNQAIQERNKRALTSDQKEKKKQQKYEKDVLKFTKMILHYYPACPPAEADRIARNSCEIGSGRVGRSSVLDDDEKAERAVIAHIRHNHTPYHKLLVQYRGDEFARDNARDEVRYLVLEILRKWENET